jgi:hypothetical protein
MNTLNCMMAGMGLLTCMAGMSWAEPAPAGPPKAESPAVKSVSGPFTQGNLTIFLLHGADVLPGKTILTLQEALTEKKAVVHETSQVNELSVENTSGDALLFIQSGDIVKGGKQDRAIAFDMLLPPKSGKVPIGSFCVEHGRWQQRGGEAAALFAGSTAQISGKELKGAVIGNNAMKQGEVWQEVSNTQAKLSKSAGKPIAAAASPSSLQLSLEDKQLNEKLTAYEKALVGAVDGKSDVIGMALCVNGNVTGAEVYGSAALFRKLWPKLLKSAATEAMADLDEKKKFEPATAKAVDAFMAEAAAGAANEVQMAAAPRQQAGQQQVGINEALGGRPNVPQQAPNVAQSTPARVRIVRYDGKKALLIESQDKEGAMPAVVHRCYIAK